MADLRERVEELLLTSGNPGSAPPPAPPEAEIASHTTNTRVDGTPRGDLTVLPPCEEEDEESEASVRRSQLRTRSSPVLSPTPQAAASALLPNAGVVTPGSGREEFATRTAASDGRGVGGGAHQRRSTVGPGTTVALDDDEIFGHALESLAARDGGAASAGRGGRGVLRAGVLGWWKRGDWRDEIPGSVKKNPRPPPAVVENQERLGSLYSMIARK